VQKTNFLLDMDGVLADFLSGAIKALNQKFNRTITLNQYATEFGQWGTYDYYGISVNDFWKAIEEVPDFWLNLPMMPWGRELYDHLSHLGEVTIVTSPSMDPNCAIQKLQWLRNNLNVTPDKVFIGSRKYLMAGNGILIDDYYKNIISFRDNGGEAILVPSTWNTPNLSWKQVWDAIILNLAL
jgi:5'(3')-deoxyribonucleotidase